MNPRRGGNFSRKSYNELYNEISQEFWKLQQVKQTPEEEEYENLIRQLETMLSDFRSEIEELEITNAKLQEKVEDVGPIKETYNQLREEEAQLKQLKRDLESANRVMYN